MSEFEFISRLRRSLAGLPEEEIDKAVEYYEDYFAEAEGSEEEVSNRLGSPEEIAENIRREILGKPGQEEKAEEPQGSFTERGFETKKDRENYQEPDKFTALFQDSNYYQKEDYYDDKKERRKNRRFFTRLLWIFGIFWIIVFICIFVVILSMKDEEKAETKMDNIVMEQGAESFAHEEEDSVHGKDDGNTMIPDQNIESIKIKIQTGTVKIKAGTEFSLTVNKNTGNANIKSETEHGKWEIKEKETGSFLGSIKDLLKSGKGLSITVTIPEGFEAENLEIEVDAGTVKADSLLAKNADLEVDAGTITIEKFVEYQKADISVDMGKVSVSSGTVKNLKLECEMGTAEYAGTLTGENKISCDMGSVTLKLDDRERYTFVSKSDMGNINIDGKKVKGLDNEMNQGSGETKVTLSVDMGTITVTTGKE